MNAVMVLESDLQRRVLEGITSTVLLFDQALQLNYINAAGEMLFAASARHLLGLPFATLIQHDEPLEAALQEALESGHPFTRHELALTLHPGNEISVDLTVVPLKDPGQDPALLLELNQIDRLLRISRDESRVAQQQATQEILRGLAHEVKNPLGGLRGAAQLLEKQLDSDDLKEYTSVIISEADRLQKLVNRILGPNKLPNKSQVNIHEVLEHVRQLVLAEVTQGIHIQRDYDPSIPEVMADPDLLIQAVLNIVRNAVQSLNNTGNIILRTRVVRKFTLDKKQHDLVAQIDIIDDGPGIADDIKQRIFFPMVTGRAEGTGLGLSIAQSLIQQHEGVIECQSEPGHTVFSIFIPITGSE